MKEENSVSASLQAYLLKQYPEAKFSDFAYISSGFEADIYGFKLDSAKASYDDFVLRAYLGEGAAEKLERESKGMSQLFQAGYPVPEILLHERDSSILGKPFIIMQRLLGQSLWPDLMTVGEAEEEAYLQDFANLLGRLHRLDWQAFGNPPVSILDGLIGELRGQFTKFNLRGFFPVADWLDANRLPVNPAVVHLDFHANNVFLHDDKTMSVIDWSQFAISDYRHDLSWTLLIMGDYGKAGWREKILEAYKTATGFPADNLDYFHVFSYIKSLSTDIIAYQEGAEKAGLNPDSYVMSKELLASIRSVYERMQAITHLTIPEVEAMLDAT